MLRSIVLSSSTYGLNIYSFSPRSSLSNNPTIQQLIYHFFFSVKTLIIFNQTTGFIHLHWKGKTGHWCFSRFLLQFTKITRSNSSYTWPPLKGAMKISHSVLGPVEILWVDLCFLLSLSTEGKWPKKANLSWFESSQRTSGRGSVQMEWQGLPSEGTTLDGQSTAKNIQVGLRDTVAWQGTRRAHSPCCYVSQQVFFRHIIYKYIHLYSTCINV